MSNQTPNVRAVILAAGQGKRMGGTMLKVMHEVHGKPMIDYVVGTVEKAGLEKPVVVVCATDPAVQNFLGDRAEYVVQADRLGTGHAVSMAESELRNNAKNIVVLYGDMPFVSADSVKRLVVRHEERGNTLTMMTFTVPDFEEWRSPFNSFSRIIRGTDGHIARDVQFKDATPTELEIKELNPCVYCFKSEWLWENLKNLKNNNAQQEYYLTDLISEAIRQGQKISSVTIDPKEALGINSQADLQSVQNLGV